MWLINTNTGLLEHFVGAAIPKYATLSHTWSTDEVTFEEISLPSSRSKDGYRKITMTCQLASQAGLQYVWADTACINKLSSAELTEAINSMFRWYERSDFCVAYLEDLPAGASLDVHLPRCRWFTRGWTLQELIAPNDVHFYDQDWNFRGSKQDLLEYLTKITGIDRAVLLKQQPLSSIIVARKFSWAAHRQTTRIEDIAYCLLGIFDINMPLLYGEEEKAFRRLQVEIINTTPDLSIFAWKLPLPPGSGGRPAGRVYSGLLAESPLAFSRSSYNAVHFSTPRRDFLVTNIGIKTRIRLILVPKRKGDRYVLPLDCCGSSGKPVCVRLRKCGPDQFVRDDPFDLSEWESLWFPHAQDEMYLLTRLPERQANLGSDASIDFASAFSIARSRSHVLQVEHSESMQIYDRWPSGHWDYDDQLFFVQGDTAWDSAVLGINARFFFERKGRPDVSGFLECIFFAVGWSDTKSNGPKCSILELSRYDTALSEVQRQLVKWDPDSLRVSRSLDFYKIPRSPAAEVKIPGTDCSILVWFKPTLVRDPELCVNEFWRLRFFYEVHEDKDLPKISYEKWSDDT